MDTLAIKQEIHHYIDTANTDQIELLYAMIKDERNSIREWWKNEDLVVELKQRLADLKSGKDKGFTIEESKADLMVYLNKNA